MQLPAIRAMTGADVERTADVLLREGWGDRRIKLRFVADHPQCAPRVAEDGGEIVGTGISTFSGPVAWIGTIWVHPRWRRRGLGRALTRATMEAGEAAGCRTFVLVASTVGQPLYEGMGFEVQTWYRILEAPGLAPTEENPRIRPYRPDDLRFMAALDAVATGEDRRHLLAAFAAPATTLCLDRPDGGLGGFVVRAPWGGGATIAPNPDDAMAILRARQAAVGPDRRVRAGLLADNVEGLERLGAAGWTDVWQAPRLVLGPVPAWNPASIWGQFDHAVG